MKNVRQATLSRQTIFIFLFSFFICFACNNPIIDSFWKANSDTPTPDPTFTVTFESNGGSPVGSLTVDKGEKATRPGNPEKSGYGFVNWYDNEARTEPHYDFDTPVTGDITLFAKWSENRHTVTFDSKGGSDVDDQVVGENGTASRPVPTKDGYTFVDWYCDPELTDLYDFDFPVLGGFTLYAKWTLKTYTVTFMDGGTVLSGLTRSNVPHGTTVSRPTNDPSKDSYTFDGWYSNNGLTTLFNFETIITSNTIVYAKFNIKTYTVTFNSNGGSLVDSQTVDENSTASRPENPTRSGFGLVNWYADSALATLFNFNTPIIENTNVYAKWIDLDFPEGNIHMTFDVSNTDEWNSAVTAIKGGGNDKNYIINVIADFTVEAVNNANFRPASDIKVSFRGAGRTLTLTGNSWGGSMLHTGSGQTFILRDLTLWGYYSNRESLVYVWGGTYDNSTKEATFIMESGKIGPNSGIGGGGGSGVNVYVGGIFIMNGGEISGNNPYSGGGVHVEGGTFEMNGGIISGNYTSGDGGGVYVLNHSYGGVTQEGIFTMNGGIISGNKSDEGGGVYVGRGTFTMNGGIISDNSAIHGEGGGVYVSRFSFFTMNGGEISGNYAELYGGGISNHGTVRIVTGTIYGEDNSFLGNQAKGWFTRGSAFFLFEDDYYTVPPNAEYGTFSGSTWNKNGSLDTTDNTIRLVDGVIQQ